MTETLHMFSSNLAGWCIPALLILATGTLFTRRFLPATLIAACFTLSISAAVSLAFLRLEFIQFHPMQEVALLCSALCLLWTSVFALLQFAHLREPFKLKLWTTLHTLAGVLALLLGVTTAITQAVVLMMRAILVIVALLKGHTEFPMDDFGFSAAGLWSLSGLLIATLIAGIATQERRLGACQFLSAVMLSTWACLLRPAFILDSGGVYQRTEMTLILAAVLTGLLGMSTLLVRWIDHRHRWHLAAIDPDALVSSPPRWLGLGFSSTVVSLSVALLVCYHLVVPVPLGSENFRWTALITAVTAGLAAWASFLMVDHRRSKALAECAMGLTSLALCALMTLCIPAQPVMLMERYPMVFNAVLVGLAISTALWAWLGVVWEQQLDEGRPWTTTGSLIPIAKRFSFFTAAFALLVAAVMAVWPRWPTVSATDDTLGRMAAGLAGNLLLIGVTLWCSRRLKKYTFELLTIMAVLSTVGFLVSRTVLFSSQLG